MDELTELDRTLQQMACSNWPQFVMLIGENHIISGKIKFLCTNGFSYGQIQNKLSVTFEQARYGCNKCNTDVSDKKQTS